MSVFRKKEVSSIQTEAENSKYKRDLTAFDLINVGVGGIIGAGIFVLTGIAARDHAGPAIVISYLIAGFVSSLASLCYAELASSIPVSGSAYAFTYIAIGELAAWIVGWDLMLEYLVGGAAVASALSNLIGSIQSNMNKLTGGTWVFDPRYMNAPLIWLEAGSELPWDSSTVLESGSFLLNKVEIAKDEWVGAYCNAPAFILTLCATYLLLKGIKETASVNNIFVITKLLVVVLVIVVGFFYIDTANYTPYVPESTGQYGKFGFSGIIVGATTVFFAYIGFDSVSTVAQESKNPGRDLPIGIIGSLSVCTVLYILVSVVITGMVPYQEIEEAALSAAFEVNGLPALGLIIAVGGFVGLGSVLLNLMIGQPRIFQSMAGDGLFAPAFAKISKTGGTPHIATMTTGIFTAICSALFPVDFLGHLTSIGTLLAFVIVSIDVMILRYTQPDLPRKFKIGGPEWFGGYFIPGLSALCSGTLIFTSTWSAVLRVAIWMALGLVIYLFYGYRHSKLATK
jgi:APA family basic amino acid/polyamine antiporter